MTNHATMNQLHCGDNLDWLPNVADESVSLCYIDPPFFSNRNYEVIWGNGAEIRSFGDRFSGGISHYIEWMRPRVALIHQKLKKDGAIFLHCDWHASHRLRVLLDEIFFPENFLSEISWKRIGTIKNNENQGKSGFQVNHDTILHYGKSSEVFFQSVYGDYSPQYIAEFYKYIEPETNRKYRLVSMIGPGGAAKGNPFYEVMGIKKYWRYSEKKMQDLIAQELVVQLKPGSVPQKKQYLDEGKGVPAQSLWTDISFGAKEFFGYPTQKPEALVSRVIASSSKPGDLVLDCFGGGGVTAIAAARLQRYFIVGDVSPVAIRLTGERLKRQLPATDFEISGLPRTISDFEVMKGHQFAALVCRLMGWKTNPRLSGDAGIDGWNGDGHPVQIKNHATPTGRPDLQRFFGALAPTESKQGIFVAWEFSKQAFEFCAEVSRVHKITIKLVRCVEVFAGILIAKEKQLELDLLYAKRAPNGWANEVTSSQHDNLLAEAEEVRTKVKSRQRVRPLIAK